MNSNLTIDGTGATVIDNDIYEVIDDFQPTAEVRKINLELRNVKGKRARLVSRRRKKVHGPIENGFYLVTKPG